MKKFDKAIIGAIVALILPIIGYFLSYFYVKSQGMPVSWERYFYNTFHTTDSQAHILIFCMIPNMFLFYFSNFMYRWDEFTKGLVGVSLLLGLTIFFLTI